MVGALLLPFAASFFAPLAGCSREDSMDITGALEKACSGLRPGDTLAIAAVAPFAWDELLLAGPYTPASEMQRVLAAPLPSSVEAIGIDSRDDVNAIMFLDGGAIVHAQALPRRVIDFDEADLLTRIPRAQARFVRAPVGVMFVLARG